MWFKIQDQEVMVRIIAKPLAKKTMLLSISDEGLHIALHAAPHKGQANKELILYLSDIFQIPKSRIVLKRGENSKHKQVIVPLAAFNRCLKSGILGAAGGSSS